MKRIAALVVLLLGVCASGSALAGGHYHHGGHYGGHYGGGVRFGVFIGAPVFGPWWWYSPPPPVYYAPPAYYDPPVIYRRSVTVAPPPDCDRFCAGLFGPAQFFGAVRVGEQRRDRARTRGPAGATSA